MPLSYQQQYALLQSGHPLRVLRDGVPLAEYADSWLAMRALHQHPYSAGHALRHEGFSVEPITPDDYAPILTGG